MNPHKPRSRLMKFWNEVDAEMVKRYGRDTTALGIGIAPIYWAWEDGHSIDKAAQMFGRRVWPQKQPRKVFSSTATEKTTSSPPRAIVHRNPDGAPHA
jgi:hypothetical protein